MKNKTYRLCSALIMLAMAITACQSPLFSHRGTPVPTPQCIEPTLNLGASIYRIDTVSRESNAFPKIPRKNDVAYWAEDTTINYVFGLSPTKDNLALDSVLKEGDPITINWADCSKDEYVLQSIATDQINEASIFDQSSGGVTIYIQDKSTGLIIHGTRPVTQSLDTPEPTTETAQLDISILDVTQSEDNQFVTFRFLITNQGTQVVTLTDKDISLIIENGPEIFPTLVEPALPQEFKPGDIIHLEVTFPKPQANSVVLRILDITLEYYF